MKKFITKFALVCFCIAVLAACETKSFYRSATLGEGKGERSVVLMPIDIELGEKLAGGLVEPKAEWTDTGRQLMTEAIEHKLREQNARLIVANPGLVLDDPNNPELKLLKLHEAIGTAIMIHKISGFAPLPSKSDKFDWTLGPDAQLLKARYGSDYALFVWMRDSYASAGRAAAIAVGLLLGVYVQGGTQVGFATLVDLKTGDVVWINRLARESGDLRKPEGARGTVALLLDEFPK